LQHNSTHSEIDDYTVTCRVFSPDQVHDNSKYVRDIIKGSRSLIRDVDCPSQPKYSPLESGLYFDALTTDPDISGKLSLNLPESLLSGRDWLALST